jgi:GAF domain-containing protein
VITTERLLDLFIEVADTLVDAFDLIEFLHNLADQTVVVSGASSVGILLADQNDELQYMAASSSGAAELELFQLQSAEGPCPDCYRTGEPVIVDDLRAALDRWPSFVPRAASAGIRSVHAFPMRLRDRTIGALNVFGKDPAPLEEDDVKVIQALADVATIALIQEQAIAAAETLTEQLQGALNSRIVIEQAKGVVARSKGMSVDQAFTLLRSHARGQHMRLTDLAFAIATGATDPSVLGVVDPV